MCRIVPVVFFLGLLAGSEHPVAAQLAETPENLIDRIRQLEAEVAELRQLTVEPVLPVNELFAPKELRETVPTVTPNAKKTYPTIRVTGFFQADAGLFDQDPTNVDVLGDIQDGADFRRARLAAAGSVAENVGYKIEFDFGFPGRPSFMDVWLEVRDLPVLADVKIGLYVQPFGLGARTSARELTFIERGLPSAFVPFRQIGGMSSRMDEERGYRFAISGFRFPTDVFGGQVGDNGGYGMSTRLAKILTEDDDGNVIHLGAAYTFADPANDVTRYRSSPEFFVAETGGAALVRAGVPTAVPPFVDTGIIPTSTINLFGAEFAATYGPVHASSEYIHARVDRMDDSPVGFHGFTAQTAYLLTGEHRPYKLRMGSLGRIVPNRPFGDGGAGAWEIAARWSLLDLDDGNLRGGTLNSTTLGLNWYLNRYTKFQLNYIRACLDSSVNGSSSADIYAIRAQLDF